MDKNAVVLSHTFKGSKVKSDFFHCTRLLLSYCLHIFNIYFISTREQDFSLLGTLQYLLILACARCWVVVPALSKSSPACKVDMSYFLKISVSKVQYLQSHGVHLLNIQMSKLLWSFDFFQKVCLCCPRRGQVVSAGRTLRAVGKSKC